MRIRTAIVRNMRSRVKRTEDPLRLRRVVEGFDFQRVIPWRYIFIRCHYERCVLFAHDTVELFSGDLDRCPLRRTTGITTLVGRYESFFKDRND